MKIHKFKLDLDQHQFFAIHNYQIYTEPDSRNPSYYYFIFKLIHGSMKFTATIISFLVALIAKTAFADRFIYGTASYEDGHQDHALWVYGTTGCQYVYFGPYETNPCAYKGGWFKLDNIEYQLVGCGTSEFCIREDGSPISCAEYAPGGEFPYHCGNKYGPFLVSPVFIFR